MTFVFKSRTKSLLFKYSNFHEFFFYILNFHFNYSCSIKTTSFRHATLDKVEVRSFVEDIKTKFMKFVIFKTQTFCSSFKYKTDKSSRL